MRSQISHMLADSAWEQHVANLLETSPLVEAYAKNDHLGFQIHYMWNGAKRRYIPDFLIRLTNGRTFVLEVKGEDSDQHRVPDDPDDERVGGTTPAEQGAAGGDRHARHRSSP